MKLIISAFVLSLTPIVGNAQEPLPKNAKFELTEASLIKATKKSNPQISGIIANREQQLFNKNTFRQRYQWHWVTGVQHTDSDEKAIAAFIPTFGPTFRYQTGLKKRLTAGVAVETSVFSDQQSSTDGIINRATRSGVDLSLSIDLWKNLFGRMDRAELADARLTANKAEIESKINSHIVTLELRKLYWSLVANREQIDVTMGLLKTAEKQLADAKKRGSQYIADKGEIARYKAQVSSRRSTIKSLEYQRDLMLQNLKNQIPHLALANIELGPIDTGSTLKKVHACAFKIGSYSDIPWGHTKVDELLKIIDESYEKKKIMSSRYSDMDIQLTSRMQMSGVDNNIEDSFQDLDDEQRKGYQVGLQISIPLGSPDSDSKKSLINADYNRYQMQKNKLLGEVKARQTQTVSMVNLLKESVKNLRENGDNLAESIQSSQKKFRQARISLNALINEQDALLNSRLAEIDAKLLIMHTLLDYFQTFTEDPCEINRLGA